MKRALTIGVPVSLLVGCSPGPKPVTPPPEPTATVATLASSTSPADTGPLASAGAHTAPPPASRDLLDSLKAQVAPMTVDGAHLGRRVLYSWTTPEQAKAILAGGPILTREKSERYGWASFDWAVLAEQMRGDTTANMLFHQGFAKKRFAWANAYAAGPGAEQPFDYGSVLLRIELADNAWILDLTRHEVVDMNGAKVPLQDLEKSPARLGAVYWETESLREFVLCNESMIAKVAMGTDAFVAEIEAQKKSLSKVAVDMRGLPEDQERELLDIFARSLVFKHTAALSDVERIARLMADVKLEAGPKGEVAGKVKTFALGAPRPKLIDDCKVVGRPDPSSGRAYCTPPGRCTSHNGACLATRYSGYQVLVAP